MKYKCEWYEHSENYSVLEVLLHEAIICENNMIWKLDTQFYKNKYPRQVSPHFTPWSEQGLTCGQVVI